MIWQVCSKLGSIASHPKNLWVFFFPEILSKALLEPVKNFKWVWIFLNFPNITGQWLHLITHFLKSTAADRNLRKILNAKVSNLKQKVSCRVFQLNSNCFARIHNKLLFMLKCFVFDHFDEKALALVSLNTLQLKMMTKNRKLFVK